MPPPPIIWKLQEHQLTLSTPEDMLAFKYIDITPHEFRFFYARKAVHFSPLRISLSSTISQGLSVQEKQQNKDVQSHIQVIAQQFGYEIGCIHAEHLNRPQQLIVLQVHEGDATYALALLKQIGEDFHWKRSRAAFSFPTSDLPHVEWYGPVGPHHFASFKFAHGEDVSPDRTHVCLRLDDPKDVDRIPYNTYLEYLQSRRQIHPHPGTPRTEGP